MFLAAPLRHAWKTVKTSRKMLVAVGLVDLLVCLPPAIYVLRQVQGGAANRADALDLAKRLSADFMSDLRSHSPGFDDDLTHLCWTSFAIWFLLRPFIAGAYTGLAAAGRGTRVGQFASHGGQVYWKYLRLAVLAGLCAYLLSIAAKPLLAQVDEWALMRSEPAANRYKLVTNLFVIGALAVASMIFDYARVGVRLNRRPGILAELGRSALFVLQHPASTLAMFAVSIAIEIGAVLACGWVIQIADGGYFTTSVIVLVLFQAVVTVREAARLFHIAGAWKIRAAETGDESREPAVVVPESDTPDVLRSPLPWNAR